MTDWQSYVKPRPAGNFLNAKSVADMNLVDKPLTIKSVESLDMLDGTKPLVGFMETEYKLPLNKTNTAAITAKHGTDDINWTGKIIKLNLIKVKFQGQFVDSISVVPQ